MKFSPIASLQGSIFPKKVKYPIPSLIIAAAVLKFASSIRKMLEQLSFENRVNCC